MDATQRSLLTVQRNSAMGTSQSLEGGPLMSAHRGDQAMGVAPVDDSITPVYVLCIPMHKLSRALQFMICFAGVVISYLLYYYFQDHVFRDETFKQYGWYLTVVQFCLYSLFGLAERTLQGGTQRRIPIRTYMLVAFLMVVVSDASLGYLDYPTEVIFKSCQLIPVMIGGVLIQGKRYSVMSVVAMVMMCVGLVFFNVADVSVMPNMDIKGVLLMFLVICAEAILSNIQEKAMTEYSASVVEIIVYSYSIALSYALFVASATRSLVIPFHYCLENPKIYVMTLGLSVTGYLGVNFALGLVKSFGALLAVIVTTFGKTSIVIVTFFLFRKPFTQQFVWSGVLVLLGIIVNVYSKKNIKSIRHSLDSAFARLLGQGIPAAKVTKSMRLVMKMIWMWMKSLCQSLRRTGGKLWMC